MRTTERIAETLTVLIPGKRTVRVHVVEIYSLYSNLEGAKAWVCTQQKLLTVEGDPVTSYGNGCVYISPRPSRITTHDLATEHDNPSFERLYTPEEYLNGVVGRIMERQPSSDPVPTAG